MLGQIFALYIWLGLLVFVFMTAAFCVSRLIGKRNDLADVVWGLGFIIIALSSLLLNMQSKLYWQELLPVVLVIIWGSRLSIHIFARFRKSTGDPRYANMVKYWKHPELRSYLSIFLLQGLLMLIISAPVIFATSYAPRLTLLVIIGIAIWAFGFIYETIADRQLRIFLARPGNKGTLLMHGLWKYSRHPNYFGEITQWWGLFLIAASCPYGWISFAGPLLLTFLITNVSGVPLVEARYKERSDWMIYARKTSVIIPWRSLL